MKEIVEVVRLIPRECIQQRTAEKIVVPVAKNQEQIVQCGKDNPRGRPCERVVEQIMACPFPRVVEDVEVAERIIKRSFQVARLNPQECFQRTVEEMVDVPVSRESNVTTEIPDHGTHVGAK